MNYTQYHASDAPFSRPLEELEPSDPRGPGFTVSGQEPIWMRLRHATLPLFRPPSTISSPTYERELIRGQEDPATGIVSWYIADLPRYVCGPLMTNLILSLLPL